jgi:hypothetical protein
MILVLTALKPRIPTPTVVKKSARRVNRRVEELYSVLRRATGAMDRRIEVWNWEWSARRETTNSQIHKFHKFHKISRPCFAPPHADADAAVPLRVCVCVCVCVCVKIESRETE